MVQSLYMNKRLSFLLIILSAAFAGSATAFAREDVTGCSKVCLTHQSVAHENTKFSRVCSYVGTYKTEELLDDPEIKNELEKWVGAPYTRLIRRNMSVRGPVEFTDGTLFFSGIAPHLGGEEQSFVLLNVCTGKVSAALMHKAKFIIYAEGKEYEDLPKELREYIADSTARKTHVAPDITKLPVTAKWIQKQSYQLTSPQKLPRVIYELKLTLEGKEHLHEAILPLYEKTIEEIRTTRDRDTGEFLFFDHDQDNFLSLDSFDLNDDGHQEVAALFISRMTCGGNSGCPLDFFSELPSGQWITVGCDALVHEGSQLLVSEQKTNGYHDIYVTYQYPDVVGTEPLIEKIDGVLKWDGKKYSWDRNFYPD